MRFKVSDPASLEFGDAASLVPVGDEDVFVRIDKAPVSSAEHGCIDVMRIEFVLRPLRLQRIVAEECNWHVVFVENRDSPFQFRNDRVIPPHAHLARTAQMMGHGADVFPIEIEMAKTPVFAIAYQQ